MLVHICRNPLNMTFMNTYKSNKGVEDRGMTPKLKKGIEEAERACREGRCITCNSKEELNSFLTSL